MWARCNQVLRNATALTVAGFWIAGERQLGDGRWSQLNRSSFLLRRGR